MGRYTDIISDMHKDAYGFRPSGEFFRRFEAMTDSEQDEVVCDLQSQIETSIREEEELYKENYRKLVCHIDTQAKANAVDKKTVLRWLIELEEYQSLDYLDWDYGVKYGTFQSLVAMYGLERGSLDQLI